MKRQFNSNLAEKIEAFLEQKHALGFAYCENERYLANFDAMCAERFQGESTITREMGMAWAISLPNESRAGLSRRMSSVRELAKYILRNGDEAFVIPTECGTVPSRKYIPHIFSHEELQVLFATADTCFESDRFPLCTVEPPVLLRLLYACGLRPYEGRTILRENIDLDDGTIFIPESKKLKDRVVIMDSTMLDICRRYDEKARLITPDSAYFFPSHGQTGKCHDGHWPARVLNRCLINAGITEFTGNAPRPYDLRHTFATHTLLRWMQEGHDLDSCLPYLSAYMGHEKFQHTLYYIHLIPDFFPEILPQVALKFDSLIPEVSI
jgi:integrase